MPVRSLPFAALAIALVTRVPAPAQDSDLARYLTARAAYHRTFDSLWKADPQKAMDYDRKWVAEQGPRLRRLSGTLAIGGLTDSVKLNIGSMSGIYETDALVDGLQYRTRDSVTVFVTDSAIFSAWAHSARGYGPRGRIEDVLKDAYTFTEVFDVGAHGYRCGDVPVTSTTKHVFGAMLVEYSQDQDGVCSPEWLTVSVRAGRRIIVAEQAIPSAAQSDRARLAAMAQALVNRLPDR